MFRNATPWILATAVLAFVAAHAFVFYGLFSRTLFTAAACGLVLLGAKYFGLRRLHGLMFRKPPPNNDA